MGKHQNHVAEYEQLLRGFGDADISVTAAMMFGFDTQTPSCYQPIIAWLGAAEACFCPTEDAGGWILAKAPVQAQPDRSSIK